MQVNVHISSYYPHMLSQKKENADAFVMFQPGVGSIRFCGLPVPCVSYCTWLPTIFSDSLVFCSNVHGSRISLLWQIHSMVFVFQDSSLSFQKSVMHIATNRANGTQEHFFKPSQKWSPTFLTEITPTDISA